MELAEHFAPDELGSGFIGRHQGTGEGLVLIARAADGAHGLSDLRGRRVARLANDRLAQVFLETQCLRLARKSCDELFEVMEEKRDNYSIHKVFFGQADAALVSLSAYHAAGELNPQVRQKLRIIGEWPVTALIFGLMPLNIDADFRDRVLSTAMQVTNTPRGRQILELFRTDHMERVEASQMQPFWALAREYQERLKTRSTRKK
jgi:ABC-type phosphate/phosphonate transport system substrate-binding protein